MTRDDLLQLIAESSLAPSVHNIQPARWRIESDSVVLFENAHSRLRVGDPQATDAAMSLGAAAEGLCLAASRRGWRMLHSTTSLPDACGALVPIARFRIDGEARSDPLAGSVATRQSWRAPFAKATAGDREAALGLVSEDSMVLADPDVLRTLASLADRASYKFMRQAAFRHELVSWMRFTTADSRWSRDGLNAEAMALNPIEARAARFILGRGFPVLQRIGLAAPLLAEGSKISTAAAMVAFIRPERESSFESGRRFYRLWLRIEAAGFVATVHAALADDCEAAVEVARLAGVPPGYRVVSVFRIGRRPPAALPGRVRLPLAELLV